MVIKAIEVLRGTHEEMGMVLNDLAVLEEGVGSDYSSVTIDYRWLCQELK